MFCGYFPGRASDGDHVPVDPTRSRRALSLHVAKATATCFAWPRAGLFLFPNSLPPTLTPVSGNFTAVTPPPDPGLSTYCCPILLANQFVTTTVSERTSRGGDYRGVAHEPAREAEWVGMNGFTLPASGSPSPSRDSMLPLDFFFFCHLPRLIRRPTAPLDDAEL